MNRFAILICLVFVLQGAEVASASAFPWVRTRPKPVLIEESQPQDQSSAKPVSTQQNGVVWHGTAAHVGTGRLYFPDSVDRQARPAQSKKPRVSDAVARGWRSDVTKEQAPTGQTKK
jgi:hypothetical protein